MGKPLVGGGESVKASWTAGLSKIRCRVSADKSKGPECGFFCSTVSRPVDLTQRHRGLLLAPGLVPKHLLPAVEQELCSLLYRVAVI